MTHLTPLEELERAKTCREHQAALSHAPNLQGTRSGRHIFYIGPTGGVPVPAHGGAEIPKGTHRSIVRLAVAAGLFGVLLLAFAPALVRLALGAG